MLPLTNYQQILNILGKFLYHIINILLQNVSEHKTNRKNVNISHIKNY